MTLRGRKNHYNIKVLTGYGVSVTVKNHKLILKNGLDPFSSKQEVEEWFITNLPYEKILISGKGYVSTDALALLSSHYRNFIRVDSTCTQ
jgi:CRISPR-associated protein Cas1